MTEWAEHWRALGILVATGVVLSLGFVLILAEGKTERQYAMVVLVIPWGVFALHAVVSTGLFRFTRASAWPVLGAQAGSLMLLALVLSLYRRVNRARLHDQQQEQARANEVREKALRECVILHRWWWDESRGDQPIVFLDVEVGAAGVVVREVTLWRSGSRVFRSEQGQPILPGVRTVEVPVTRHAPGSPTDGRMGFNCAAGSVSFESEANTDHFHFNGQHAHLRRPLPASRPPGPDGGVP